MTSLRGRLAWRGDTPLVQLGGCLPTPLLAPVATASKVDTLIDTLLAAKGYATSAPTTCFDARAALASAWWDCSLPYGGGAGAAPVAVPYAECLVARDGQPQAEGPTMRALAEWQAGQPPWATRCVVATNAVHLCLGPILPSGPTPTFFTALHRTGARYPGPTPQCVPLCRPCRALPRCVRRLTPSHWSSVRDAGWSMCSKVLRLWLRMVGKGVWTAMLCWSYVRHWSGCAMRTAPSDLTMPSRAPTKSGWTKRGTSSTCSASNSLWG